VTARVRAAAPALAAATVATVLAGCSGASTVRAQEVVGNRAGAVALLVDSGAARSVQCTLRPFVRGKPRGIRFGGGSSDEITTTVKDGEPADVVVMPAGPALDRILDELARPPTSLTLTPGHVYWVGAVDDRGLALADFLSGPAGRKVLRSPACRPIVAATAGGR